MSRRTEIQVGLTVLVALGLLLWGVTWLKEISITRKNRVWLVRFEQTGGLSQSDEVQVNGLRKGEVRDVRLVDGAVLVHLQLDSDVTLTHECRVAVRNVGLMGEKVIAVDLRLSGTPYTERDTIPGIYELGVAEVMAMLGDAVAPIGDLSQQLSAIARGLGKSGDLNATMKNLRLASEQLRQAVAENRRGVKLVRVSGVRTAWLIFTGFRFSSSAVARMNAFSSMRRCSASNVNDALFLRKGPLRFSP